MKRLFIFILILILLSTALFFIYEHMTRINKNKNELILYGNVDVRQVDISFRVAGQIASLAFQEGDIVTKGSLMAELDKSPYQAQAREASANAESLKASLNNAEILLKRRQELISSGQCFRRRSKQCKIYL